MTEETNKAPSTVPFALAIVGVVAILGLVAVVFAAAISYAGKHKDGGRLRKPDEPVKVMDPKVLRGKLVEAYAKAADALVAQQKEHGAWMMQTPDGTVDTRAYTALLALALTDAPEELQTKYRPNVERALAYLAGTQNADGSFSELGDFFKTYLTGIVLSALSSRETDRSKYGDHILKAVQYLKATQQKDGLYAGGLGYGDQEPNKPKPNDLANLSTTAFATDGIHAAGIPKDDPYWQLVVEFAQKCQSNSEANKDPELLKLLENAGYKVGDDGGFYYAPLPEHNKTPATKAKDGKMVQTSYGSMTYDGLQIYLMAGLKKDDPRVAAAVRWVKKNYKLDGHPGFEFDAKARTHLQGLYYYYLVMARALNAYGENPLVTSDGKKHDWPNEMGQKMIALMEGDGWVNKQSRWQEGSSVLVTSYVLNVLDILLKHVK